LIGQIGHEFNSGNIVAMTWRIFPGGFAGVVAASVRSVRL
jgi:hypothetical protein